MNGTFLLHANKKFSHQTVYLTGHVYRNCVFESCTLVCKDVPDGDTFDASCRITDCVWHLDLVVHDYKKWQQVFKVPTGTPLSQMIYNTLPKPPLDDRLPGVEEVPVPEDHLS